MNKAGKRGDAMIRTISITELRDNLSTTIAALSQDQAVLVMRRSKPAAYLVSPSMFEQLFERLEDLGDQIDMQAALVDYRNDKAVEAEAAFTRLGILP
jgi:prevent-host-death family protein